MKKILILIIFFYILALFQTSFLIHFPVLGLIPNLVLLSVILINLLEKPQNYSGYFSAFIGGIFLDIFSENFIGFYILISLGLVVFIKFILKRYI